LESLDREDPLAHQENLVLQDQMVHLDSPELPVILVCLDEMVPLDFQELEDKREITGSEVPLAIRVIPVYPVPVARSEPQERLA
jgi:hypothetical protein